MRSAWVGSLLLAAAAALAPEPSARADDAGARAPRASMTCPPSSSAGRLRCSVEVLPAEGESLSWADVVLTEVPPFTVALRGRLSPSDAVDTRPERWRWEFAVVARRHGKGELTGRVRAVVCRGKACRPVEVEVKTEVRVGE